MPHDPEDDWTRPMPRTPRPRREGGSGGGRPRDDRNQDWREDRTERIPRQDRPQRDRYDDRDRYDQRGERQRAYAANDRYDERERYDDRRYDEPDHRRPGGPPPRPPRRRKRYGLRRFMAFLVLLLVGYLITMIVVAFMVWGSINRIDDVPENADRPAQGRGANFLLVGTDSRDELTDEQRSDFGTGYTEGSRADTVMLLHVPSSGDPTLVSLPRDSYVEIPNYGWAKLNAAHMVGGAEMLVDTVEGVTGMRINGYLEIGFGGFVGVVDEVGGVEMCLDQPMQDVKAHIDLQAGCQELAGREALGYVRMRYSDPRGDLGRVERQREFLSALVKEMSSPATVLNPFRLHQVGTATGSAIALGEDTSMVEGARMALGMRAVANGQGQSVTVPIANADYPTHVGSTVLWDEQGAEELFSALRNDQPPPAQTLP
ncbi:LCP family protein [Ornithinimicrobium sp. Y1847]|uniref:LCP family protein n=1 Tax=unclassified Ornithinimicrobium TaxID=2615080 RepID=UPI003B681315